MTLVYAKSGGLLIHVTGDVQWKGWLCVLVDLETCTLSLGVYFSMSKIEPFCL